MAELPLHNIERLIKKAGAKRVSEKAKVRMREVLESYAVEVASEANKLAKHRKKVTVTEEDIALAAKGK